MGREAERDGGHLGEEEEDPELLAELATLMMAAERPAPPLSRAVPHQGSGLIPGRGRTTDPGPSSQRAQERAPPFPVDDDGAAAMTEDLVSLPLEIPDPEASPEAEELTDGDMRDPELLAALSALLVDDDKREMSSGSDMGSGTLRVRPVSAAAVAVATASAPSLSGPARATPALAPGRSASGPTTILQQLEERQLQHKQRALRYKRSGDMVRARECLSIAKLLQTPLDLLRAGGTLPPDFVMPPILDVEDEEEVEADTPSALGTTPLTHKEREKHGAAQSRARHDLGVQLSQPTTTPMASVIAKTTSRLPPENRESTAPTASVATLAPSRAVVSAAGDVRVEPLPDAPCILAAEALRSTLTEQIATCTTLATMYYKLNRKSDALLFHKLKRAFSDYLEALPSIPSSRAPIYALVSYDREITQPDLAMEELEVGVVGAFDLGTRDVPAGVVEAVVAFEVPGLGSGPPSVSSSVAGETGVAARSPNPMFRHTARIPFTRGKALQRLLERKRAIFDVYHQPPRTLFSLLGLAPKRVPLGRAILKLEGLLTTCAVSEVLPLMDPTNPRKPAGGRVEVQLRVRTPLLRPEVVHLSERWVMLGDALDTVLGGVPVASSRPAPRVSPSLTTDAFGRVTPTTPARVIAPRTLQAPPSPQRASVTPPATQPGDGEGEHRELRLHELTLRFTDPDTITSNAVLEAEHAALEASIARTSALAEAAGRLEEERQLRDAYALRMNVLVTMVQLGQLSMPAYTAQVQAQISEYTRLAVEFKRLGDLALAKRALARVRWMRAEVAEVLVEGEGDVPGDAGAGRS